MSQIYEGDIELHIEVIRTAAKYHQLVNNFYGFRSLLKCFQYSLLRKGGSHHNDIFVNICAHGRNIVPKLRQNSFHCIGTPLTGHFDFKIVSLRKKDKRCIRKTTTLMLLATAKCTKPIQFKTDAKRNLKN